MSYGLTDIIINHNVKPLTKYIISHNLVVSGVYSQFFLGQTIQLKDLLDRFTRKVVDENYQDNYLKIANIFNIVLSWVLVDNLDIWNAFPWGAYTYGTLTHYILKLPTIKKGMKGRYYFYGSGWVLRVIFAYPIYQIFIATHQVLF